MPAKAVVSHVETAEFDDDIRAGCNFGHALAPALENLVALSGVNTDADDAAQMVQDHDRVGEGARQVQEVAKLGVAAYALKNQSSGASSAKPSLNLVSK